MPLGSPQRLVVNHIQFPIRVIFSLSENNCNIFDFFCKVNFALQLKKFQK